MSILSDIEIVDLCQRATPMLSPFLPYQVRAIEQKATKDDLDSYSIADQQQRREKGTIIFTGDFEPHEQQLLKKNKVLSYGTSSYGYDCRLSEEIKIFSNINGGLIDPKRLNPEMLVDGKVNTDEHGDRYVILPPNSYLLGCTIERFHMPRDVLSICLGKSTMARSAVGINVTPIEPGFIGNVVIEISNLCSLPVKIYTGEGIAQFLFFKGDQPCGVSYADRDGKYQHQEHVTLPKA